jgi:hypothetical protein
VLHSNIAACYLKLEDWKAAVDSATVSIERLDKVIPPTAQVKDDDMKGKTASDSDKDTDGVVEISGDDEESEEKELQRLKDQDEQRSNVMRIRAKSLMRRAKAKSQIGGWGSLQGAAEDYQTLSGMENLPADDKRIVQRALRELPEQINRAREKEMGDMMGKLKDVSLSIHMALLLEFKINADFLQLGNGILKPFGLSTDNFNFVQDPKTGGYNMNFQS